MSASHLTGTSESWVIMIPEGSPRGRQLVSEVTANGGLVHYFDAHDLMTEQGVIRVFAETLHFPGYFGWNWDAWSTAWAQ